jgi:GT2 family glycosyltransferase
MISVVIPNLNSPLIAEVVGAVDRQSALHHIAEVLVVGQNHDGRTPASARRIGTPRPVSAAVARNLGARVATGEYLLFLDSDCIAAPDLIEHLLARHAEGHPVVGGGVVVERADYWSDCDNLLIFAPFLAETSAGPRAFLPSLNFSISRSLFTQIGGFDEGYAGAAGEDLDLCLRLRAAGHPLFFEPAAWVIHRARRSSPAAAFAHLRGYGRAYIRVRGAHSALLPGSLGHLPHSLATAALAAAPVLALANTLGLLRHSAIRARPALLPGLAWARLGWYLGVLEAHALG